MYLRLSGLALFLVPAIWAQDAEKLAALAESISAEIQRISPPVKSGILQDYVGSVGNRLLASGLRKPGRPYRFVVIQSDDSEPVPLPSGIILVPLAGLLGAADEDEFAGMLAHSIGHVELEHGLSKQLGSNASAVPLIYLGGWTGSHAAREQRAPTPLGFLARQREQELEADRFAARLSAEAGFDPSGYRRYVERTQSFGNERNGIPDRTARLASFEAALNEASANPPTSSAQFARAQREARGILPERKARSKPTLYR